MARRHRSGVRAHCDALAVNDIRCSTISAQIALPATQYTGCSYTPHTAPADCVSDGSNPPDASSVCARDQYSAFQVQRNFFTHALANSDQLRQRVAFPANGTVPNQNYAREVLQLFSIGLVQLNADGSQQLDVTGAPLPTFDSPTIEGFAAVFTGWTGHETIARAVVAMAGVAMALAAPQRQCSSSCPQFAQP